LDYSYRREGTKGYLDTVGAVERCIRARGFTLEHVHDLQATLASKGFAIDPLRIYEFDGRRPLAAGSIDEDADARLDLLMPCRVNVFVENESARSPNTLDVGCGLTSSRARRPSRIVASSSAGTSGKSSRSAPTQNTRPMTDATLRISFC
jgi:hypothetical protein